ncbi:MAG TPA: PadR family transcriptional regulator [Candidatus Dormibacteraeota bacterium]|nr:PadR family transcriptional regulator [Candidatus Dormibacteraeota bacterium]
MDESDWLAQTRRGVLELGLLMLLRKDSRYGYELVTALARWPALEVSEGTLYPLLRRLERSGLLTSSWRESPSGPPRKYYSLTNAGRRQLDRKAIQWEAIGLAIADLKRSEGAEDSRGSRRLKVQLKSAGGASR